MPQGDSSLRSQSVEIEVLVGARADEDLPEIFGINLCVLAEAQAKRTGERVDDAHETEFADRAVSTVDDVIAELKEQQDSVLRAEIDSEITTIENGDGPTEAKIRELRELSNVIDSDTTVQSSSLDPSVVSGCRSLTDEARAELHSHVRARIQTLSDTLTDSFVDDIVEELVGVLQTVDHPRYAVDTFEAYVNGNESIGDFSALRPVCDEYDQLERLRDDRVISRTQFESARKALIEEVVALKRRYEPDSQAAAFVYYLRDAVRRVLGRSH